MKFNTPTTRHVKSTRKRKLVAIYVETDGLEDGLVHYIKSGKVATNAAAVISAETAMFIAGNKDNLDQSDHLSSWSVLTHCTALNVVFVPYKSSVMCILVACAQSEHTPD